MPRFYVENFGCRATQADGAAIERELLETGFQRAIEPSGADVAVLNTCTVTAAADHDARAAIRRIHRNNPGCKILVTGCYAQRAPQEIAAIDGVSAVVGNSHKHQVASIAAGGCSVAAPAFVPLASLAPMNPCTDAPTDQPSDLPISRSPDLPILVGDIFAHTELLAAPVFDADVASEKTRPNLKVQDGCDNRCSFCVIPYVRGHSRSLPLGQVLREVDTLVAQGYRELVLSGINLGRWGRDLTPTPEVQRHTEHRGSATAGGRRPPADDVLSSRADEAREGSAFDSARRPTADDVLSSRAGEAREGSAFGSARRPTADDVLSSRAGEAREGSAFGSARRPTAEGRRPCFQDLLRAILDRTSLEKLRISSVEPMDWSDQLIALVATSPRIARHAHLPLQSGSDKVLRRMHRRYRPWHYAEKVTKIRAAMPSAAIGADVMVGFPGETDAEFEETRTFIADLPFTYLHVFTFSARPGTPAATMRSQVPGPVARERNRILRELVAEKNRAFRESFVGQSIDAITLTARGVDERGPFTEALTDNYLKLRIAGAHEANRWMQVEITGVAADGLAGRLFLRN